MRDVNSLYEDIRTCPEESIFMVGSLADGTISGQELVDIYLEYAQRRSADFPQLVVLDWALHMDEQGAPHIHERRVWVGHDKDGNPVPSQNKALQEMGVGRPDQKKAQGRRNNPKMLFTQIERERQLQICKEHGLSMVEQPRNASKTGLALVQYQTEQEQKKLMDIRTEQKQAQQELERTRKHVRRMRADARDIQQLTKVQEQIISKADEKIFEAAKRKQRNTYKRMEREELEYER